MKKFKKFIAAFLALVFAISLAVPAFAAGLLTFDKNDAEKTALTAAKAKYAIEGVSTDTISTAKLTKMSYSKSDSTFKCTVRADRVHKYTCEIKVNKVLGAELALPDNTQYVEQNVVAAFFGQFFEGVAYFFIKLVGADGPK